MSTLPIKYTNVSIGEGCKIRRATLEIVAQICGMYDGKIPVIIRHIEIFRTWALIEIETGVYYSTTFRTLFTEDDHWKAELRQVSVCGSIRILFAVIRM